MTHGWLEGVGVWSKVDDRSHHFNFFSDFDKLRLSCMLFGFLLTYFFQICPFLWNGSNPGSCKYYHCVLVSKLNWMFQGDFLWVLRFEYYGDY